MDEAERLTGKRDREGGEELADVHGGQTDEHTAGGSSTCVVEEHKDGHVPERRTPAQREERVERTNYFTVEVYGPEANLCAERLGKGSRVVVDGEFDCRECTDPEQNRREAAVLRARQILCDRARPTPLAESMPGGGNGSPDGASGALAEVASPAGIDDVPSNQAGERLARGSADGRAATARSRGLCLCAPTVDPARAVEAAAEATFGSNRPHA